MYLLRDAERWLIKLLFKSNYIKAYSGYRSVLFSLFEFNCETGWFSEMALIIVFGFSVLILLAADTIEGGSIEYVPEKGSFRTKELRKICLN